MSNNRLRKQSYQKVVLKERLPNTIKKQPLPKIKYQKIIITKTMEIVTNDSNGLQKTIKTISNGHKGQTILIITKSPFGFKIIFYLSITTIHLAGIRFLFHYDVNIVKFPFIHSLFFVSNF